jgi:uncharacterized protein
MPTFTFESEMPASVAALWKWHEQPGAFARLNPPFDPAELVSRKGGLEVGAETVVKIALGPKKIEWVARHTACEKEKLFVDEQISGPFSKWIHRHHFIFKTSHTSVLRDEIEFELPMGALGEFFAKGAIEAKLKALFRYRHVITKLDLQRQKVCESKPLVFAITGASGMIGSALIPFLSAMGHEARAVKRNGKSIDVSAFHMADVVVNLAGAGVADERWTPERKQLLRESRIEFTRSVVEAMKKTPPKVLIQGSAIGIYGDAGDTVLSEDSALPPRGENGAAFLSALCQDWELEGQRATEFGTRVVQMRIGLVQSAAGGALGKMLPIFKAGAGGPIGNGRHWQSWISMEDILGIILFAATHEKVSGPINAVGPKALTSADYAKELGRVLHRPSFTPAPAFALKMMFGEMAQGAILASQHVVPKRLSELGFPFAHESLGEALTLTLGK